MQRSEVVVNAFGGTDYQVAAMRQAIEQVLQGGLFRFRVEVDKDVADENAIEFRKFPGG